MTWLSLMLDRTLFGKGPVGPHFTNLLLHAANTVLVFLLFRCLMNPGSVQGAGAATWQSALIAALFALHPLHVESVAWVTERKDVLSAFFGLLALFFYTRDAQRRSEVGRREPDAATESSAPDYAFALLFFALGLMSKPMLVTLPFVMLLLDYWPLQRFKLPGSGCGVWFWIRFRF